MISLRAMRAVYCYFFPEVRGILRRVSSALPDEMFLVTTPCEQVEEALAPLFDPPLDVPSTAEGYVCLDDIHEPVIDRIVRAYTSVVPGLEKFPCRYPTQGSSEGIFKLLAKLKVDGEKAINVIDGEYEGYEEYAGPQDLRMEVVKHRLEEIDPDAVRPGVWFISNPSARDGNIIPNEFIRRLCERGHRVILDLAYVGATAAHEFFVDHENVVAVFLSFSKPYGVFRFRIGGFTFAREPLHSLYGNKWFKDTLRLLQALKIAEEIGPATLYAKYRSTQSEIIDRINEELALGMKPSDSLLIGHITGHEARALDADKAGLISPYKRGGGYRFCLTPYFEESERRSPGFGGLTPTTRHRNFRQ